MKVKKQVKRVCFEKEELSDELETQLFAELPLEQPTWNPNDFSPSIYQSDDRLGELYTL